MTDPKQYTVHMIGNAHIDHAWLWRWEETYEKVLATCRSALDRMKETPEFIFSFSSAVSYKWLQERAPQTFEEIRQRVAEGRWSIVGGWWLQPDCNIPCGESFVRQALYGKRYFQETFGVEVTVGYNVDSFGHAGTLPQILQKSGQPYYVFFRPDPEHEIQLESSIFWWESPDGSRVLACRPPLHYNTGPGDIEGRIWAAYLKTHPQLRDVLCFYGVGNHGGGPTVANIEAIQRLDARPDAPQVKFSTLDRFFQAVISHTTDFPGHRHGLQYHARGCYTAVSEVKRHNRQGENLLMTAEKFAALANSAYDHPYPHEALTKAWQNVLFNQFHDVLGGSSIPEVYEDARELYEEAYRLAGGALNEALKALAVRIDTRGPGTALVVFNPLAWRRRSPVEVDMPWEGKAETLCFVDEQGAKIPIQLIPSPNKRVRAVFLADLPPLGYRVYYATDRGANAYPQISSQRELLTLSATPTSLENAWWRLDIDPATGYLTRLYDKRHAVDVLAGPGDVPLVLDDPSDTWSHGVDAYREEIGRFGDARLELVEEGPVRAVLRIGSTFNRSSLEQDLILYRDLDHIDCRLSVDWHEKHRMLKLSFPCNIASPTATYEAPYGHIARVPNGDEEPGQQWIDVTGVTWDAGGLPRSYGLGLLNDCKYGFSVQGPGKSESADPLADIRLSVLRSPLYAFQEHGRLPWGPGKIDRYTDQGRQTL
ncbi:MAG: alpha-mannosidase, partial [Anaerolineae bacterium]